jgi:hypothetical protein
MKTFKEYLAEHEEFDSGTIDHTQLSKHLLPSEIKSIHNHPYFREYVGNYVPGGSKIAYRVTKDRAGFKRVYAGNSQVLDTTHGKIRRMAQFDMKYSGRSVDNAHLLHNVDGKRHTHGNKNIWWDHIKSHKDYGN